MLPGRKQLSSEEPLTRLPLLFILPLKKMLPSGCRFRVLHHASMSNMGLQLADYCNWAIFRKWESGDCVFYDALREGIKSELEI